MSTDPQDAYTVARRAEVERAAAADLQTVGEILPFPARARKLASGQQVDEELASSHAPFSEVVKPIELADDAPLISVGRGWCETAYASHPNGFRWLVADTLKRTNARSYRSLLVYRVKANEHVPADALAGPSTTRAGWRHGECRHPLCQFTDHCEEGGRA